MTTMTTITKTNKQGTKTSFHLEVTEKEISIIEGAGFRVSGPEGREYVEVTNKKDAAEFSFFIDGMNKKIETDTVEHNSTEKKNSRYTELLSIAQRKDLNHGQAWICTSHNVDAQSLNPAWEGELVCYVYN